MGIGSHTRPHHGETNDWLTPPEIIQALGPFDLDPCCPPDMPWRTAAHMISRPADGAAWDWHGQRVWLNPPYGAEAAKWMRKLADHGNGIAILFARTETAMYFDSIWPEADGLLFIKGRLYFHRPDGKRAAANSGGPSVLVAYGAANVQALAKSGIAGTLANNWSMQ